ncbi:MAG: hypothetical protein Q8P13_01015 [bacterium]|nr:hypothetical protein [bacterium]
MDKQIFTTKNFLNLNLADLKERFNKPKYWGVAFALFLFLGLSLLGLDFYLSQTKKTAESSQRGEKVFEKQDPTTYFEAVFFGYDSGKGTILVQVTKNGLSSQTEVKVNSTVSVERIVYEAKTQLVKSKTKISLAEIKPGENVRLVVKRADTKFDFSTLKEIQVLESK